MCGRSIVLNSYSPNLFYIEILSQIISSWGFEGVQIRCTLLALVWLRCTGILQHILYRVVDAGKIMDAAEVAENKLFLLHPKMQPNWIAIVGRKNVGYNANTRLHDAGKKDKIMLSL
ncbi:uncharacterized protein LOC113346182 [Papaver somniferum]|uniref:uncharacterized protein LOC113346182 n=1 Tax=Papaver somniferum TaxID=3469 RepID=UPI000E703874|nr:uncharacterized protein LOC113346182 [Papaver somniferum]